jgi:hypothetical protein
LGAFVFINVGNLVHLRQPTLSRRNLMATETPVVPTPKNVSITIARQGAWGCEDYVILRYSIEE